LVALYITSFERSSGKTAICAGLGKHLLGDGKKTGFFKPIVADIKSPPIGATDSDAAFIKHVFALEEPVNYLCPVINDHNTLANRIKEAYIEVSRGKDVVIVEGIWRQRPSGKPIEASFEVVEALDARVIIVEGYSKELSRAKFVNACRDFGEYLLGVILNKVPESQVEHVRGEMSARFGEARLDILGVLPEDRVLSMLTIGELTDYIQGEILNNAEKSAELVENLMVGAMCVDSGLEYFSRKANKAAVVRDDRPDMQLAALETSTRCLVISGNTAPIYSVRYRAEDKGVPIILTKNDADTIVKNIEEALDKTRFNQEKKLLKLTEIMEQHLNFQAIYRGLGLAE